MNILVMLDKKDSPTYRSTPVSSCSISTWLSRGTSFSLIKKNNNKNIHGIYMINYVSLSCKNSQTKKVNSCKLTLSPGGPLGPGGPSSPWGEDARPLKCQIYLLSCICLLVCLVCFWVWLSHSTLGPGLPGKPSAPRSPLGPFRDTRFRFRCHTFKNLYLPKTFARYCCCFNKLYVKYIYIYLLIKVLMTWLNFHLVLLKKGDPGSYSKVWNLLPNEFQANCLTLHIFFL